MFFFCIRLLIFPLILLFKKRKGLSISFTIWAWNSFPTDCHLVHTVHYICYMVFRKTFIIYNCHSNGCIFFSLTVSYHLSSVSYISVQGASPQTSSFPSVFTNKSCYEVSYVHGGTLGDWHTPLILILPQLDKRDFVCSYHRWWVGYHGKWMSCYSVENTPACLSKVTIRSLVQHQNFSPSYSPISHSSFFSLPRFLPISYL